MPPPATTGQPADRGADHDARRPARTCRPARRSSTCCSPPRPPGWPCRTCRSWSGYRTSTRRRDRCGHRYRVNGDGRISTFVFDRWEWSWRHRHLGLASLRRRAARAATLSPSGRWSARPTG